jgi:hypothetical protein
MEDIRTYRNDEQEPSRDQEREFVAASSDDEVPFHIPRD